MIFELVWELDDGNQFEGERYFELEEGIVEVRRVIAEAGTTLAWIQLQPVHL